MKDIAARFKENPLLKPADLAPSRKGLEVICLLNPGVFIFNNKIWLLIRVAETFAPKKGFISFPAINAAGDTEIITLPIDDADLVADDPRVIQYKGLDYLTTLSHLRLVYSTDGKNFTEDENYPPLLPVGRHEQFGIEDCRVTVIDGMFYLTYTAVSQDGVAVGMRTTKDWKNFNHHGIIIPPHNKDCAIFEEKVNGKFYMLHRPSSVALGGNFIWLAESYDGVHWGNHVCIIKTRPGLWDSARVGAGAAPVKTEKGWLEIYHGADDNHRYCLGAFLMDLSDPSKIISRTTVPIMVPTEDYELNGFFGHVVFTNGHIVEGDRLTIYYGASDEFICGAEFSIPEIMSMLEDVT